MTRVDMILVMAHTDIIVSLQEMVVGLTLEHTNLDVLYLLPTLRGRCDGNKRHSIVEEVTSRNWTANSESLGIVVAGKDFAHEDNLVLDDFPQVLTVAYIWMLDPMVTGKYSDLEIWPVLEELLADNSANLSIGTYVE
mmetsp:Transcript_32135/g.96292  ORF Transcript_32135/g.96292 Transcript_32135/m.96292 type:complete len:138 (-) Transcript_32135:1437-1850(-)